MSNTNEPVVETPVLDTPVEAVPASESTAPVEQPVQPDIVYEYQPMDDLGRPLGSKQVFKGKTYEEILEKVSKAHKEAIKLNRELNKKNRLGIVEAEEIPQDAELIDTSSMAFEPKPLTAEERLQLSRDLLDPDKFDEASARLLEANLGARPDKIRDILAKTQNEINALQARENAKAFVQANPDYYICKENFETMTSWMVKNNLAPTRNNFQYAFNRLKEAGLLLEAPIVREEPVTTPVVTETPANSQPEQEPVSRITNTEPSQAKRSPKVASGLTKEVASDTGPIVQSKKLTVKEIEAMPSEVYKKRLLTEPNFKKMVDEAYAPKQ